MAILETIENAINSSLSTLKNIISENPLTAVAIGSGVGGIVGAGVTALATSSGKKAKKKAKKSKKKTSGKGKKLKFGSKAYRKKYLGKHRRSRRQRQPHTAGKRKDTSHRRIRFTKNNQPYVILPNGRARFIKRSSVRASRKRKGGRY